MLYSILNGVGKNNMEIISWYIIDILLIGVLVLLISLIHMINK